MFYHFKIKYTTTNEEGREVKKNEEFLVNNCELHGEAEARGYQYAQEYGLQDVDVVSVKRSNIREFINESKGETDDMIYDAVLCDVFIDEVTGKETECKYHVGVYARSVSDATSKVHEYMKQGLNFMRYIAVKETKIVDILEY